MNSKDMGTPFMKSALADFIYGPIGALRPLFPFCVYSPLPWREGRKGSGELKEFFEIIGSGV
jgi:hypothetical protein